MFINLFKFTFRNHDIHELPFCFVFDEVFSVLATISTLVKSSSNSMMLSQFLFESIHTYKWPIKLSTLSLNKFCFLVYVSLLNNEAKPWKSDSVFSQIKAFPWICNCIMFRFFEQILYDFVVTYIHLYSSIDIPVHFA